MFNNHAGLPPPAAASRRRPFWPARRPRTAIPVIAAGATFAAAALAATGNRAPAPKQAATTKPDAPPKAVTDNKAPLGNKTDEPCTVHCAPHGHHGHEH